LVSEAGFEIEYAEVSSKRPPKLEVESVISALKILVGEQIQEYHRLGTITKVDDLNGEILHILSLNTISYLPHIFS
jgi:hypothetical protein